MVILINGIMNPEKLGLYLAKIYICTVKDSKLCTNVLPFVVHLQNIVNAKEILSL